MPADMPRPGPGPTAAPTATVEVPATSANLGPGFDCLGLALDLVDRIEARFVDGPHGHRRGGGCRRRDACPRTRRTSWRESCAPGLATFDDSGDLARRGLALRCTNCRAPEPGTGFVGGGDRRGAGGRRPPGGRGRGGVRRRDGGPGDPTRGTPGQRGPGVLGGATIAWMQAGGELGPVGRATRFAVHPGIAPVLVIPAHEAFDRHARGALPGTVPHADAAFNVGRSALLVHALSEDPACSSRPRTTDSTSSSGETSTRRAWTWSSCCAPRGSRRRSPVRVRR